MEVVDEKGYGGLRSILVRSNLLTGRVVSGEKMLLWGYCGNGEAFADGIECWWWLMTNSSLMVWG